MSRSDHPAGRGLFRPGDQVRFRETYGTGVLVDGGPFGRAGEVVTVLEVSDRESVLVDLHYDGRRLPQYVPTSVLVGLDEYRSNEAALARLLGPGDRILLVPGTEPTVEPPVELFEVVAEFVFESDEVEVCTGCALAGMNGEELPDRRVDEPEPLSELPEGWSLVDVVGESFFSWRRCGLCGGLPGTRFVGTIMSNERTEVER